jgi:cobalt-zinc-cadmium efflux system protein
MSAATVHEGSHSSSGKRNIVIALSITTVFFIIELVGGTITNSLALTADAWHMLTDASALAFTLVAELLAERPTDVKKTYGYYRTEILAAFLNGIFLWAVMIFIFYVSILRFLHPVQVESLDMLIIAVAGLVANGLTAFVLSKSISESLNIKGAFLHVISDTLDSVAAISAGLIMIFTAWYQADPLFSMLLGVLIFYSSYKLTRESVNVLLEGVPYGIDMNAVEQRIIGLKGVKGVHDLHVWCITPTKICAISCHVVVEEDVDRKKLLSDLIAILKDQFGIDHTTIQLEEEGYPKAESEHS